MVPLVFFMGPNEFLVLFFNNFGLWWQRWDNDGDFLKEQKDHHQSVLFASPTRLAKRDAQTSYPNGNSGEEGWSLTRW